MKPFTVLLTGVAAAGFAEMSIGWLAAGLVRAALAALVIGWALRACRLPP